MSLEKDPINKYPLARFIELSENYIKILSELPQPWGHKLATGMQSLVINFCVEIAATGKISELKSSAIFFMVSLAYREHEFTPNSFIFINDQEKSENFKAITNGNAKSIFDCYIEDIPLSSDATVDIPIFLIECCATVCVADGDFSSKEKELLLSLGEQLLPHHGRTIAESALKMQRIMISTYAIEDKTPNQEARADQNSSKGTESFPSSENNESLNDAFDQFDSLVGLTPVKTDVQNIINGIKVNAMRIERGMPAFNLSNHLVFYGNPGTGKTTVARLISKIYKQLGILSKGHLVEVDRSGLVAGYVGQTALKVKDVVDTARGGILFVDEAYALNGGDNDFGQEAIDTLLKLMEDRRDDFVVIVAGYTKEMQDFLNSNPGLRSRFNKHLNFPDYAPDELMSIFETMLEKAHLVITPEGKTEAAAIFNNAFNTRDENFGNARLVRNIYEKVIANQANRLMAMSDVTEDALRQIVEADIRELCLH